MVRVAAARVIVVVTVLAAVTSCRAAHTSDVHVDVSAQKQAVPTSTAPTAVPVRPNPDVGAVFLGAGSLHTCSAAVLNSLAADLILTAAHCLANGIDATFVAGLDNDAPPEDVWHVDAVYLDQRWLANQDPHADFAIARVSRAAGDSLQARTGGGLALGVAPRPGSVITVTGYGLGVGGQPISCTAPLAAETDGFPSLPCGGVIDGLSGAPWIDGTTVRGIVGGLHGGGCDESVSYSPPFDDAVTALLARAEASGPADIAPTVFADDDC
jgi:Trypsin